MNSPLHSYAAYRPSALPWRGDVPEHWKIVRLKHAVQINPETLSEDTDPEYGFDYMDINSVGSGRMVTPPVRQVFGNAPSRARRVVRQGDTAISTVRTYLKAAYHLERDWPHLVASTGFAVLRPPKPLVPALLGHIVQSDAFIRQVVANSVGVAYPAISETKLGTLLLFLPPLPEQAAIVRYLDHADRRIRRYVDTKRKLIALLEEEKQAILNQAVTRGMDPNAPLKPSGVEWLGDMPEHWERCRLRNVVSVVTTGSRGWSSYASDTGPLFIRVANLNRGSLQLRFDDVVRLNLPKTSEVTRTRIKAGDILVSVTAYIGSVGIAPDEFEEAYVSQHVARCQPRPGSSSQWLGYVLLSTVGQTHGQVSLYGGTKDGLSLDDVKNYQILLPPLAEQTAIVEHIDKATADIDAAIGRAHRQIDLIQEYRTRLIADVVTGKLDVREAAAQLPDEADDQDPLYESGPLSDGMYEDLHAPGEFAEELAMPSNMP